MNLIDSSAWIEYLREGSHASALEKYLLHPQSLIVPTLVVFEVYRFLVKKVGMKEAIFAITQLQKGTLLELNEEIALYAAELSLKHQLATADSIVYASALLSEAQLITLDNDFRGLPSCKVFNAPAN